MEKPLARMAAPPTPSTRNHYPFYLGGLATAMAGTITHPLDLTKVRLQTMDPKPTMVQGMIQCVQTSGFSGLFEGITATWYRGMTYAVVRFWAFDFAKDRLDSRNGGPSIATAVEAGLFAGLVGGIVSNPGDIVLIRMQAESSKPVTQRYGYKNAIHGLYRIVRDEGAAQLGRGMRLTVFRALLTNSGQLASYDVAKRWLLNRNLDDGLLCHFLASTFAGTVGTTVSQPADVIRSRLMAASHNVANTSPIAITRDLVKSEGLLSLMRGYLPSWSRQTPQTILTFVFLEQLRKLVDYQRSRGRGDRHDSSDSL